MLPTNWRVKSRGFSLPEILSILAITATLTGVGVTAVSKLKDDSAKLRLDSDVAAVNSGVAAYVASGGSFPPRATPAQVIATLKKVAAAAEAKRVVGFTGNTVDLRLKPVLQTTSEARSSQWRAVWSASAGRFVVQRTGSGVKEFVLDEASIPETQATDTRATKLLFAANDSWVWDPGTEATPVAPVNPDDVDAGTASPPTLTPQEPAPRLQTPTSSLATGSYTLSTFPQLVTLTNPNPSGSSVLQYTVNGGSSRRYDGPFLAEPGTEVAAVAVTVDPTQWEDSVPGNWEYDATPVKLEMALRFEKTRLNYFEVGGIAEGSSADGITPVGPGRLTLTNGRQIPTAYQTSAHFQPMWTYDASNPLSSGTRTLGAPFTAGYPGDAVPISLDKWGDSSTLTVTAAAQANVPVLLSSDPTTATLRISRLELGPPVITSTATPGTYGESTVTLAPDTSVPTPAGVRIFYTTDGTWPGDDGNGRPTSGTLYTAPFAVPLTAGDVVIRARAFAPEVAAAWFTPKRAESTLPGVPALDAYIGGVFAKADGSSRNIARLGIDGSLDPAFNPGSGATPGSVVAGVERDGNRVLAVGDFISVNGLNRTGIVRLNASGAVDTTFVPALK